ncbi:hypothetical protein Avbf_11138 [Armadillidium vulgare]|nr:hypothetical protein Avbf_11138 [Armadillidium vulgare]
MPKQLKICKQRYCNFMQILFLNYFQRKIRIPTSFHVKRTAYNRKEPKGKLIERHRNIREKFRKLGLYSKQNFKSRTEKSVIKVTICQMEQYFEKQQWQKFNRQPWKLVEQIWKETSANRILINIDFTTVRHFC